MQAEFERKHAKEAGSILRGASLASKMSSKVARGVGQDYLCELFGPWVKKVEQLGELNVEIEAERVALLSITNEVVVLIRCARRAGARACVCV